MIKIDLPEVTRVHTAHGSHIEPDLEPDWRETDKLAWRAAVTAHDTGLRITVHDGAWTVDGKTMLGYYSIAVYGDGGPVSSASSFTYRDAWTYLNGVEVGARAKEAP